MSEKIGFMALEIFLFLLVYWIGRNDGRKNLWDEIARTPRQSLRDLL